MKNIILVVTACLLFASAFAQTNTDSLAYELQRAKINNMLAMRSQKFGKYDQSLSRHTGIFGLQTKKDIRRSNEILMDIVKTDNAIYKQLKILLDYRTFQQNQVVDKSKEIESTNLHYMNTINTLRSQNEKLTKEANEMLLQQENSSRNYIIIIIFMGVAIGWLLWRKYNRKTVGVS
ncbi:hypothetical protein GCM10027049_11600 [Mucilaginibacter puniceus]